MDVEKCVIVLVSLHTQHTLEYMFQSIYRQSVDFFLFHLCIINASVIYFSFEENIAREILTSGLNTSSNVVVVVFYVFSFICFDDKILFLNTHLCNLFYNIYSKYMYKTNT